MRKSDLRKNHERFSNAVGRYRSFMHKVVNAKSSAAEKRDLAESVLLRLCAQWEAFVDEHLVDCVNRDHSKLSSFFGATIPKNPTKELCQVLLYGDRYRDFRSVGELKRFSRKIMPDDGEK